MAAKMPGASTAAKNKRKAKADDISEKDEFHLPQIVSITHFAIALRNQWMNVLIHLCVYISLQPEEEI